MAKMQIQEPVFVSLENLATGYGPKPPQAIERVIEFAVSHDYRITSMGVAELSGAPFDAPTQSPILFCQKWRGHEYAIIAPFAQNGEENYGLFKFAYID